VKLNISVIVFYGQDSDILNGDQFVDWINIDILLVELLLVSLSTTVSAIGLIIARIRIN